MVHIRAENLSSLFICDFEVHRGLLEATEKREGRVDEINASSKATSWDVLKCYERRMASNSAARRAR